MGMISLFRTPRPQQFKYTPIFYDPTKESLKQRENQIKQELGISDENAPRVSLIRGQIRGNYERKIKGRSSKSTIRLVIIFIILCIVAYYLIYY